MIELFGFVRSRSNRAMWALEEIGAEYKFYQLDFSKGDNRSDFFLNLNPAGKMPVLKEGDLVLAESAAICNYLGERFPESGLTPAGGTRERALYDQWMFFVLSELEQPLWTKGKHSFGLPEDVRVPAIFETAIFEWQRAFDLLCKGYKGPYFLGDRFTMVDILVAHTLRWAVKFEFPVTDKTMLDYLERMEARPAWGRMYEKEKLEIPRS